MCPFLSSGACPVSSPPSILSFSPLKVYPFGRGGKGSESSLLLFSLLGFGPWLCHQNVGAGEKRGGGGGK